MALTDGQKQALEWAGLVPGLLRAIGTAADDEGFIHAADVLSSVSVAPIGAPRRTLRPDEIDIDRGSISIADDIEIDA